MIDALRIHRMAGTAQLATDREIRLMGLLCAAGDDDGLVDASAPELVRVEDLPEGVREHFERMDPDEQPARERWLHANWSAAKERREHWRRYFSDEQVRARREGSKGRDRELLERNRAACGLPPLAPEQLARWGLEGTRGEGGR